MKLPKIVQVTLDAELAAFIGQTLGEQPLASLSKILKQAALQGYRHGVVFTPTYKTQPLPDTSDRDYEDV